MIVVVFVQNFPKLEQLSAELSLQATIYDRRLILKVFNFGRSIFALSFFLF